jgi:1,4-dihydroxy-2-naphthoate octaprenyltransferase
MLLTIAVVLIAVDLVTTLVGVRMAGPDIEANAIHRRLMERHGVVVFAVSYLAGAAVLVLVLSRFEGGLAGMVGVLVLIAANNLYGLTRLRRSRA